MPVSSAKAVFQQIGEMMSKQKCNSYAFCLVCNAYLALVLVVSLTEQGNLHEYAVTVLENIIVLQYN